MNQEGIKQGKGSCVLCGRDALGKYGGSGKRTGIEGPGAHSLKDGSWICGSCVRLLRVIYPLQCSFDEGKHELVRQDPLRTLDAEDALAAKGQVVSFREDLREKYGFRLAVFRADAMAESKGGLLQAPIVTIFGQVLYGTFFMQDEVTILSGGKETKAAIAAIDDYTLRIPMTAGSLKEWVRGCDPATHIAETGYPCRLVIQAKGISLQPGDLIVKG